MYTLQHAYTLGVRPVAAAGSPIYAGVGRQAVIGVTSPRMLEALLATPTCPLPG